MRPGFRPRSSCVLSKARRQTRRGSAMVEAALLLPLLLFLILNAVNFGVYIYGMITVDNAARAAALYRVYNGVAVGAGSIPTYTAVNSLVTTDVSTMLGHATMTLSICSNKNGTTSCSGSGVYSPVPDPNPTAYTLYSAEVSYTYTPLVSFAPAGLGLSLNILPTTVRRRVVMRSMQ